MLKNQPHIKAGRLQMLAAVCVVVAALYLAQDVLIPIALSIMLCFLLTPIVAYLERWRIPRVVAVSLVVLSSCAFVGGLGYVVFQQLIDLIGELPKYKDNIRDKVEAISGTGSGTIEKVTQNVRDIQDIAGPATQEGDSVLAPTTHPSQPLALQRISPENPLPVQVIADPPGAFDRLSGWSDAILGKLGIAGIVIVFVFFMLLAREDLRDRLIRLWGYGKLTLTTQAMDEAAHRISRYLLAQAIVNGTYGVAIGLGLWVIGLVFGGGVTFPNLVLWALLCALLRFIPYVGPWIGALFPLAVAFAVFKGFWVVGAVLAMFATIELFSNNLMEPWLYGSSTGMSTIAVLVAAVFWTWLWGPIGLLLATPLTCCLVVLGKYVPQLGFLELMLGDQPVLSPGQRVYQRLLSGDQEEAVATTVEFSAELSIDNLYDTVLIDALALAEQDNHAGDLDDTQRQFVRTSIREMLGDLFDRYEAIEKKAQAKADKSDKSDKAADDSLTPTALAVAPTRLSHGEVVRVLILPARDEADEVVGMMLAQLLSLRGYTVKNVSVTTLAGEMVELVRTEDPDIVIISALPPAATLHARYLCKRLSQVMEHRQMVIGLWTSRVEIAKSRERMACPDSAEIVTSLPDALSKTRQLASQTSMGKDRRAEDANV